MKDVDDMTLEETMDEISETLLDYIIEYDYDKDYDYHGFCEESRIEQLYTRLMEDISSVDVRLKNFIATIEFIHKDESKKYHMITNIISGFLFSWLYAKDRPCPDELADHSSSSFKHSINEKCATYSLAALQQELTDETLKKVFKGHHIVSFEYLLANPRKDVVEWALVHKDELGIGGVSSEFIEKYQAIPELKELIFQSLQSPINQ